jgi:hypothetical protein
VGQTATNGTGPTSGEGCKFDSSFKAGDLHIHTRSVDDGLIEDAIEEEIVTNS